MVGGLDFISNFLLWNTAGRANYFQRIVGTPIGIGFKNLDCRLFKRKYNYISFSNGKCSDSEEANKVLSNTFPNPALMGN